MTMNGMQRDRLAMHIKALASTPEFQQIRDFYTGEASNPDPQFDELDAFIKAQVGVLLGIERLGALKKYGKA